MLTHDVVETENELSAPGGKPKKKNHPFWSFLGNLLLVLFFTLVLAVSGQVTYNYTRYQSFFVNGESMYPTLNENVTFTDADGNRFEGNDSALGPIYNWGNFTKVGTYVCDYGLMDTQNGFSEKLKRFDIVVTYFNNDFASGVLFPNSDLKIKRVIALPGESFYLDADANLYVKAVGAEDYALEEQSFLAAGEAVVAGWQKQTLSGKILLKANEVITLGADDFYLMGDNRLVGCSTDSRVVGPVARHSLVGKAVALTGFCSYTYRSGSDTTSQPIWNRFLWPWQLKDLDE